MILLAAVLLAGAQIDEAEHALAAGRVEQAERMLSTMMAAGQSGDRIDRLRAGTAAAAGRNAQALSLYAVLATRQPADPGAAGGAARAAFLLGKVADARRWSALATASPGAGWRDWNLCGAIADTQADFERADHCYGKAEALAPARAEVLNNRAWSYLLRGRWSAAAELLRKALAADPTSRIARANLDLAESALGSDLPVRRAGESANDFAARLNDSGVVAEAAGDRKRAVAAFANALSLRPSWSARIARNLEDAERR